MFNPLLDLGGIYTYTVTGTGPCANNSATVTVTLTAQAVAGIDASVNVCSNQSPINLFTLLGSTAQTGGVWSPILASGTNMFNPALDVAGPYTYTVTGAGSCTNNSATVTVTITPQALAGVNAAINLCSNEAAVNLFALLGTTAQTGGVWSPALASGTNMYDPALDLAGSYTYTVSGVGPCSDSSAVVVVTITPEANAGTSTLVTICNNEAPVNLFTLLGTSAQTGGVWSPALSSGTGFFNPLVDLQGTYTYTVTGQNSCTNNSAQVDVTILIGANPGTNASVIICTNSGLVNLFGYLGANATTGGVWTPSLASGNNFFNPLVDVAGAYTYTVGSVSCGTYSAIITVDLQAASNAGGNGTTTNLTTCLTTTSLDLFTALNGTQTLNGLWLDDNNTGALINNIFNPSLVGPGTYQFTYLVTGASPLCGPASATVIVKVDPQPNAGTFTAQPAACNNGFYNLFDLLSNSQTTGVWTNQNGVVVSNSLNLSAFAAGEYTFTYTVTNSCGIDSENVTLTLIPSPILTSANISAAASVCAGTNLIVNFSNLIDGQYSMEYVLLGANTSTSQTATVVITNGVGSFVLDAALYPNPGVTTIKFINITNLVNQCTTNLTDTILNFTVNPSLNIVSGNLSVTSTCFGNAVTVLISNATGLANGVYQFTYSVQNGTTVTGTIGSVSIVNGIGQFTIPSTFFPGTGTYTVIINEAISEVTGCFNNGLSATITVEILNGLDTSGANAAVANVCVGNSTTVTLSNLTNLQNGNYTVNYQLSGSNVSTGSALVLIENGSGTFEIPAANLVNTGTTVFKVNGLISIATNCATLGENFVAVIFTIYSLPNPALEVDGNFFCLNDKPTIADLSANIVGDLQVEWFADEFGGVALSQFELLVQDATYYAVMTSANGCQNEIRLAVTVDLNKCNDLIIPDGFSPNNDGINDTFEIENIETIFPNFKIEIFNRYGNIVYKGSKGIPNWDGTASSSNLNLNKSILPIGVYFYILDFNDGSTKPKQGRLYLNR